MNETVREVWEVRGVPPESADVTRNVETRWRSFARKRRALLVRGVAESLVYPGAIVAMALILAFVLAPDTAEGRHTLMRTLLSDLTVSLGLLVVPLALALGDLEEGSLERRWLAYWWDVVAALVAGAGLAPALEGARMPASRGVSSSPRLHAAIARGADIPTALTTAGCPEPFPTVLRQAAREAELPALLIRQLEAIQDRLLRRAEMRLRLAQPIALAAAGAAVLWLVVRVGLPVITRRMEDLHP